ncbi:MAG: hypothetical protein ACQER7_10730 [Bacteroidota bacterium]
MGLKRTSDTRFLANPNKNRQIPFSRALYEARGLVEVELSFYPYWPSTRAVPYIWILFNRFIQNGFYSGAVNEGSEGIMVVSTHKYYTESPSDGIILFRQD